MGECMQVERRWCHLEVCSQRHANISAPRDRAPPDLCSRVAVHTDNIAAMRAAECVPPAIVWNSSITQGTLSLVCSQVLIISGEAAICSEEDLHQAQGSVQCGDKLRKHGALPCCQLAVNDMALHQDQGRSIHTLFHLHAPLQL